MNSIEINKLAQGVLLNTYSRPEFVLDHGKGVFLYDKEGNEYLDCVAGIAVNALGYQHPVLTDTLKKQADKLWHCSNLYHNEPQIKTAELLVKHTFADKVFFSNSGAEAMEGAIKIARKWGYKTKGEKASNIITFRNSFHGRTYAAVSATGQPKFWEGFHPIVPGFNFAEFNDIDSVRNLISDDTCAVLIEPIQGESGIFAADKDFLVELKKLCDEFNCLLIFDEIQCGIGRTGTFCAYEQYNIQPDIMTIAKPLAGGLPMGAILMNNKAAQYIEPGNHGSTFGGGPLITAVAEKVIQIISEPAFLKNVKEMGAYLKTSLEQLKTDYPEIKEVRGTGLMLGVEFSFDPQNIIKECLNQRLLICKAGNNTARFLPPLIIEKQHIDMAVSKFVKAIQQVRKK